MAVIRIGRISFTASDAERLGAFYQQAFGFEVMEIEHHCSADFARLTGVEGAQARALPLRLGEQTIELLAFTKPGAPYPADITCDDPRFQHIAIVVADMEAAYLRLCACKGWTAITRPAPQRLPASSGGVTAFKFRDPEGHPLELLAFPPDNVPPRWRRAPHRRGSCLGIDHSAIVVSDTAPSVAFYQQVLGFSVAGGSLNHGPEQEQLDAVTGVVVEVTALDPGTENPPHLELLCYRSARAPRGVPEVRSNSNDIAATRLVLDVDDMAVVERRLAAACVRFISKGIVALRDNRPALLIRDPDGHAVLLLGR
jgi:catechol 2,3-dioxygenase-like lactoylglutathione lyase family enzyme